MLNVAMYSVFRRFDSIPIIGGLAHCSLADHKAAMKEFLYAVVFSTITFWMSSIVLMAFESNKGQKYSALLASTISNGELFIFSVGFLGPALLITIDDPVNAKQFPGKVWHALAFILLGCIAAALFALIKAAGTPGMPPSVLNRDFLFSTSVILGIVCCVLRYLSIVYRKFTLRPDDLIKEKEKDFSDEFARRHGVR